MTCRKFHAALEDLAKHLLFTVPELRRFERTQTGLSEEQHKSPISP